MKRTSVFIIVALAVINCFILIRFNQFRQQCTQKIAGFLNQNIEEADELHSHRINFTADIENSNIKLQRINMKDSLNEIIPLQNIFNDTQKYKVVCRFSEMNCESCVNFSIQALCRQIDSIGKENVLFLGAYRNNKIFNKEKALYGLNNLHTYNISILDLPAEQIGYPYYFIISNELKVFNLFIPDKAVPQLSTQYLALIKQRYFTERQIE
jgi:hypothetical protein